MKYFGTMFLSVYKRSDVPWFSWYFLYVKQVEVIELSNLPNPFLLCKENPDRKKIQTFCLLGPLYLHTIPPFHLLLLCFTNKNPKIWFASPFTKKIIECYIEFHIARETTKVKIPYWFRGWQTTTGFKDNSLKSHILPTTAHIFFKYQIQKGIPLLISSLITVMHIIILLI